MPGTTSVYALPYQTTGDPPNGPTLGEDLAEAVEAELVRIDAEVKTIKSGELAVTFTSKNSDTRSVSFGHTFTAPPRVTCNINSSAASTARWDARATAVTTTGFTMFLFYGSDSTSTFNWSNILVQWIAVEQ